MSDESRLIPCEEAVRQLWDYLDGEAPDHAAVEQHLAFCQRCCGEVEFVGHLRRLLSSQLADEVPPPVSQRLERFVEEL